MLRRLALVALAVALLASCSSGKDASGPSPTSRLREGTTTTAPPATAVVVDVVSPLKASVQGSGGRGMIVHLSFQAKDPAALPAEFRLGGALPSATSVKPGHNPAFPGLVVVLTTTGPALGGPTSNLANLFQIVSPSLQPDGSMRVSAIWTNADAGFGSDVDVLLSAFAVQGTAPDTVPVTVSDLAASSNLAQVTFHLAGGGDTSATATATTEARSTTTTKAGGTTTSTKPGATTTSSSKPAVTTTTTKPAPATTSTTKLLGLF